MEQTRQNYLAWLREAHAMERQSFTMLQDMTSKMEDYPRLRARLREHLRETEGQLSALAKLLGRKGAETSLVKDATGQVTAFTRSMSDIFTGEEVVQGTLASYTFENLEIASYRILITAAEQLGDAEAVEVFQRSLAQEEAMADWLASHSGEITRSYLSRAELLL